MNMFKSKRENPDFVEGLSCPVCFDDNTETYVGTKKQSCLNCSHEFPLTEAISDIEAKELERCTFCGNKSDASTRVVGGYIILTDCTDCEEEILGGILTSNYLEKGFE